MSIYQKFFQETLNDQGFPQDITLNYPENFNFGYDVVDAVAEETPQKTALVWCNTEGEEHAFTFADIQHGSNRMANVFAHAGLRRGMRVMLVLKRHYEYWFAVIALHKLGITAIPATHMLTVSDYVYRIQQAQVDAIVCMPQDGVPEALLSAVEQAQSPCILWSVQKDIPGFRNLTREMQDAPTGNSRHRSHAAVLHLRNHRVSQRGHPRFYISAGPHCDGQILAAGRRWRAALHRCGNRLGQSLLGKALRAVAHRQHRHGL